MREIGRARFLHRVRVGKVVLAVRHAEPALEQERRIAGRVLERWRDPQAEQVVGVEVSRVQDVDVSAQAFAEVARERGAVADRRDLREHRLQRRDALRFDAGFVHEAGVVVADLLRIGAGLRVLCRGLDEVDSAFLRLLRQDCVHPIGAAVGGNWMRLCPGAVRVGPEVIARRRGGVHRITFDANGKSSERGDGEKRADQ